MSHQIHVFEIIYLIIYYTCKQSLFTHGKTVSIHKSSFNISSEECNFQEIHCTFSDKSAQETQPEQHRTSSSMPQSISFHLLSSSPQLLLSFPNCCYPSLIAANETQALAGGGVLSFINNNLFNLNNPDQNQIENLTYISEVISGS